MWFIQRNETEKYLAAHALKERHTSHVRDGRVVVSIWKSRISVLQSNRETPEPKEEESKAINGRG
jgi:hypothetical protein